MKLDRVDIVLITVSVLGILCAIHFDAEQIDIKNAKPAQASPIDSNGVVCYHKDGSISCVKVR